jgi:hypothetical protein
MSCGERRRRGSEELTTSVVRVSKARWRAASFIDRPVPRGLRPEAGFAGREANGE